MTLISLTEDPYPCESFCCAVSCSQKKSGSVDTLRKLRKVCVPLATVRRVRADRSKAGHDPKREREGAKEVGERGVPPNATHAHDRMRSVTETRIRGVE